MKLYLKLTLKCVLVSASCYLPLEKFRSGNRVKQFFCWACKRVSDCMNGIALCIYMKGNFRRCILTFIIQKFVYCHFTVEKLWLLNLGILVTSELSFGQVLRYYLQLLPSVLRHLQPRNVRQRIQVKDFSISLSTCIILPPPPLSTHYTQWRIHINNC